MENLISFLRMFNSYLFVVIIAAVVIAVAITIGINVRKAKNAKELVADDTKEVTADDAQKCETEN